MADAIDDLFRRFGKAFNKADVEEIAACVTDDFEWRLNAGAAGGTPGGRVLRGKDDLRAHFADNSLAHREARFSHDARAHPGACPFRRAQTNPGEGVEPLLDLQIPAH